MERYRGWILDAYPCRNGMRVWVIDQNGRAVCYDDPWSPYFYLQALSGEWKRLESVFSSFKIPFSFRMTEKREFFSNQAQDVIEIRMPRPFQYQKVIKVMLEQPSITLFNADLNLVQTYFYEKGLFPLAFCELEAVKGPERMEIRTINTTDSPWQLDYPLPPFRYAYLGLDSLQGERRQDVNLDPGHKRRGRIVLTLGTELDQGVNYVMDGTETDLIQSLNRHIHEWDPDIILSDWGDGYIMPRLQLYSAQCGKPLCFSRDAERNLGEARARSFFSYGKIVHRAGDRTLFGRLHIDTKNSFVVNHTHLDGLFEVARVAKIPLQRAARSTIGTSLSSIQHQWAIQNDYLIPVDKGQTEDFRPAEDLLVSDRGGLVYEPELGWHEDLIEYDFVSMYPEIMIRHNVTPEAINCACCPHNKVPEIPHHICQNRIGMMPHILSPLVEKRQKYKELIRKKDPHSEQFKRRREAFKWALVTCFGYLGFRNARFGRIEAHECVNAFSREVFLKAKETAENEGFHFVHGIVDSLWLKKPGATSYDIESLRLKIEKATGLPLGFEGRYRWIHFCRSKTNHRVGVPSRYVGAFTHGELKVRGIELRRHDTPPFIKALQTEMLEVMKTAGNLKELEKLRPQVKGVVDRYRDRIRNGQFEPVELSLSLQITRAPSDYVHDTLSAVAAKKLAAAGVELCPGEMIQYVVAQEHDRVKDWRVMPLAFIEDAFEFDADYYNRLLDRALEITPYFPSAPAQPKRKNKTANSQQLLFPEWDMWRGKEKKKGRGKLGGFVFFGTFLLF